MFCQTYDKMKLREMQTDDRQADSPNQTGGTKAEMQTGQTAKPIAANNSNEKRSLKPADLWYHQDMKFISKDDGELCDLEITGSADGGIDVVRRESSLNAIIKNGKTSTRTLTTRDYLVE